jgi:gamma-butyrobetaine dioxygenase
MESSDVFVGAGQELPTGPVQMASVTRDGRLTVGFSNGAATFHPEWLRDNCPCPDCRIVQTDERRFVPWSEPGPARIVHAVVEESSLIIDWLSGHRSVFGADVWTRINVAMQRGGHDIRLWRRGYELGRFEHDATINDLAVRRSMFEAFQRDGAVVVTGSPTVPGTCIDYLKSIGITLVHSHIGVIFDVKLDPAGYNVAFTNEALPPHHDNAQRTQPPSGQVLAMLVNDATGGESIVVNSLSVLHDLQFEDPGAVEVLSRVDVPYRQYSHESDGYTQAPVVVRQADGGFRHLRFSNQLRQPLPFDHPDMEEWYRAYKALGAKVVDPSYEVRFRLRAGDMLFVNSLRVMHCRTAFIPDGPRHLQDIYFDSDDVTTELARLSGAAINAMMQS